MATVSERKQCAKEHLNDIKELERRGLITPLEESLEKLEINYGEQQPPRTREELSHINRHIMENKDCFTDVISDVDTVRITRGNIQECISYMNSEIPNVPLILTTWSDISSTGSGFLNGTNSVESTICYHTTAYPILERLVDQYNNYCLNNSIRYLGLNVSLVTPIEHIRDTSGNICSPKEMTLLAVPAINAKELKNLNYNLLTLYLVDRFTFMFKEALEHAYACDKHSAFLIINDKICKEYGIDIGLFAKVIKYCINYFDTDITRMDMTIVINTTSLNNKTILEEVIQDGRQACITDDYRDILRY